MSGVRVNIPAPHASTCPLPTFWLRRWRHSIWICGCGRMWRTRLHFDFGDSVWLWEPALNLRDEPVPDSTTGEPSG